MTKLPAYILILSLFLLAACNEEKKEFMTPKPDEPVLDVNVDEYSLNGTVLGKTATDISAFDDVIDKPLYKEICDSRVKAQEEGKKITSLQMISLVPSYMLMKNFLTAISINPLLQ